LKARWLGLIAAAVALVAVGLLSLWFGSKLLPPETVWRVLWNDDGSAEAILIHQHRVPRTLLGLLAGASLGLAGALMQGLTRNPLADPGLLGVNAGAAFMVALAIPLGISTLSGYVWFALVGAAVAAVIVYGIGSAGRSNATPERLVLAGAAITATLVAATSAILLAVPFAFAQFRFWVVGSLAGRPMETVVQVAPFLLTGIAMALLLSHPLNALALGEDNARALGARVGLIRVGGAVAVTLLCGAATAAIGPIGFIGLTVPIAVRALFGPDQRWVLFYSMLLAPVLLLSADVLGRVIARPGELEVGIVTAFVGAPVFIALCRRRKLVRL
jgi:iron complex transport system permease protein